MGATRGRAIDCTDREIGTGLAIPLATPNIPEAMSNHREEAGYDNVAHPNGRSRNCEGTAILPAMRRYGSRLDSMANICDTTDKRR